MCGLLNQRASGMHRTGETRRLCGTMGTVSAGEMILKLGDLSFHSAWRWHGAHVGLPALPLCIVPDTLVWSQATHTSSSSSGRRSKTALVHPQKKEQTCQMHLWSGSYWAEAKPRPLTFGHSHLPHRQSFTLKQTAKFGHHLSARCFLFLWYAFASRLMFAWSCNESESGLDDIKALGLSKPVLEGLAKKAGKSGILRRSEQKNEPEMFDRHSDRKQVNLWDIPTYGNTPQWVAASLM